MIEAIQRKGLENKFKIAIFDDTPASWSAARNAALGYGYDSKPFKDGTRVEGSHYPLLFLDPEKEDQKGPGNEFRKRNLLLHLGYQPKSKHLKICHATIGLR